MTVKIHVDFNEWQNTILMEGRTNLKDAWNDANEIFPMIGDKAQEIHMEVL